MSPIVKKLLIALGVALAAVLAYLFVFKKKEEESTEAEDTTVKSRSMVSQIFDPASKYTEATGFPVKQGMKGKIVLALQKKLNSLAPNYKITEDGLWGENTQKAFEAQHFKTPDGKQEYKQLTDALAKTLNLTL